jgi:hypothetical protein
MSHLKEIEQKYFQARQEYSRFLSETLGEEGVTDFRNWREEDIFYG